MSFPHQILTWQFSLITRTLTKYPVDFALFRELLQNGCDAKAKDVVISFETTVPGGLTTETISDIGYSQAQRLTIKNNGLYFNDDDWNRLREVAKGNPDETKIGAFGVGFYSVFELTDEPLVHSGETVMSFYFSGDQLCYRKEAIDDSKGWTTMDLTYREPKPLPDLPTFIQFLVQSFVFIQLESIELLVDNISIFSLHKTTSFPTMHIPPLDMKCSSPDKSMTLSSWTGESIDLNIKYMNITDRYGQNVFKLPSGSSKHSSFTKSLRKVTGIVNVEVSQTFARNLKATIMKPPPKEARISLVTDDMYGANDCQLEAPLSEYIFPQDVNDAKIYIGFSTKQSSSFRSHISMNQLIPTMERAAIDMANAHVKDWNAQLLHMAGVLGRVLYDHALSVLKKQFPSDNFLNACTYMLSRYEFQKSTPDRSVGVFVADGFWSSGTDLLVPSQHGILPASQVRYAPGAEFVETLPIIPKEIIESSMPFITRAMTYRLIERISVKDVAEEVSEGSLTPARFAKLISWVLENLNSGEITSDNLRIILKDVKVTHSLCGKPATVAVRLLTSYQDTQIIPRGFPLPLTCVPIDLLPDISSADLKRLFFSPLSLQSWIKYATKNVGVPTQLSILESVSFAETALGHISTFWKSFTDAERNDILTRLTNSACFPTQQGLKLPSDAYVAPIEMFPQLPVKTSDLTVSKQFMSDLGVRESVKVDFVLEFVSSPNSDNKWSSIDVVKYLCKSSKTLLLSDWKKLRATKFLEGMDGKLYLASELLAPNNDLITLGFKCIKWEEWYDTSAEAKFLYKIGLLHHPEIKDILSLANDPNFGTEKADLEVTKKADCALKYFCENFERNKYLSYDAFGTASNCILATRGGKKIKARPLDCYLNPKVSMFNLAVVSEEMHKEAWKFHIKPIDPSVFKLIDNLLNSPPQTLEEADEKFCFISTMANSLSATEKAKLRESNFIPFKKIKNGVESVIHLPPTKVFLGNGLNTTADVSRAQQKFYSIFFRFANFSISAQPFLTAVGVRKEPSITDIAYVLVENPKILFQLAESGRQYLELLLEIHFSWDIISRDAALVSKMKETPFLMAVQHESTEDSKSTRGHFGRRKNVQAAAKDVVLVDDVLYYNLFKESILTCPNEKNLEEFYEVSAFNSCYFFLSTC